MPVVQTSSLSRNYGNRRGIIDVDLSIDEGQIFGFLGPNGAGKSTTIRVLLGFLKPTSGTARIFDKDCWPQRHVINRDVGYVPGDLRLYPWMTARRAIRIVSQIRSMDLQQAGHEFAERFRLELDLPVRKMSRGNRQKVGIVMALMHRPKLLILDEPTSGLDPLMQDELAECLRETSREGRTVFFSSHTLTEVENLCDRIAIVRDGRIVVDEKIDVLKGKAPRVVDVTFNNEADVDAVNWPKYVTPKRRHKHHCSLEIHGSAVDFAQWIAGQPIADLSIGPPSLDAMFRSYYDTSAEPPSQPVGNTSPTNGQPG